ncbi:hypothetical protein HPB52_015523 [Rhipicephalus sanguineus]|uniref:Uncharacterized protein n=1 Tax=Rhipicephalus sanguineus TaxID=34632 RepID=A0A9D4T4K2_RHISA|nr:hypothetical protein HPB52_015523 [Rhipicephalus sanguineus]
MKFDFCDFLEMAAAMDVAVGLIVDKLKEVKMWNNSLFVFLSDVRPDPNEEEDLFATMKAEAKLLGSKLRAETSNMIPSRHLEDVAEGDPSRRDPAGTYGPGWCTAPVLTQLQAEPPMLGDDADVPDYY